MSRYCEADLTTRPAPDSTAEIAERQQPLRRQAAELAQVDLELLSSPDGDSLHGYGPLQRAARSLRETAGVRCEIEITVVHCEDAPRDLYPWDPEESDELGRREAHRG